MSDVGCIMQITVFRLRVLQQFTSSRRPDWVRNRFPDPMPASSAGQPWWKGHSSKQPGPAPVQRANRQSREALTWSSDEVRTQGKNPCSAHKQGKLRVTGQSVSDVPHRKQNSPEHPRDEHQTRHLTGNIKPFVYKSSAKWWKNYKTYQGWNLSLLWHFSGKELIYCCPWYSLLHNNFAIACPTATT